MMSIAYAEVARLPHPPLAAIAGACIRNSQEGLASQYFVAALEVIATGMLVGTTNPEPLLSAYIRSIRSGAYSLETASLSRVAARTLVQLAAGSAQWLEFLSPIDVRGSLAKADEPEANRFVITDEVARSLRAHIRTLCRAICMWEEAVQPELLEALVKAVYSCAIAHVEKGRVGGFSARYESASSFEQPSEASIAVELGEALGALSGKQRDTLLGTILETDEPWMLARLLEVAPASVRGSIGARIAALTPETSAEISSLTELQARIEALLAAGAADAAASFMAEEKRVQTFGKVSGRRLVRLRYEMRLMLLREEYDALLATRLPTDLEVNEVGEAQDILSFYRGLANFKRPQGDLNSAESAFEGLHVKRPDVAAYVVNLLAVRAQKLLAGDIFARLQGPDVGKARSILSDIDDARKRIGSFSAHERVLHEANRSLIFLAIGDPGRAYQALEGLEASMLRSVAAYQAVALARMGRVLEADVRLRRAIELFGETETIHAARAQITRGTPFASPLGSTDSADPVPRIKLALFDWLHLDPLSQAEVLQTSPDPFVDMVTNHVRGAAASVVALVPSMKGVNLSSCEDDLTALIRALLLPRFELVGWTVAEQPPGGFTAKGNRGRRDVVVKRSDVDLAVLEAVVCDRPATTQWARGELTSHFQKLLGYSTCKLFFHLTYAYVGKADAVLAELKLAAEASVPEGFTFVALEDLPGRDARPVGFASTYSSSGVPTKVVFLVLDMAQEAQREAARAADRANPRRSAKTKDGQPNRRKG